MISTVYEKCIITQIHELINS